EQSRRPHSGGRACPSAGSRPFEDMAFTRQSSSAVVTPVAFAASLVCLPRMRPQVTATPLVVPYAQVDRLVADRQDSVQRKPVGHLLGTPVERDKVFDEDPLIRTEM
ncbi:MAG: hypothetical protein PF636_12375, partial [Actinomycetota bacterium]|nr:hypothetical protein [Actinomycetota bacterium]